MAHLMYYNVHSCLIKLCCVGVRRVGGCNCLHTVDSSTSAHIKRIITNFNTTCEFVKKNSITLVITIRSARVINYNITIRGCIKYLNLFFRKLYNVLQSLKVIFTIYYVNRVSFFAYTKTCKNTNGNKYINFEYSFQTELFHFPSF